MKCRDSFKVGEHTIYWKDVHPSLTRGIVYDRIRKKGMDVEKAISKPRGKRTINSSKWITVKGERVDIPCAVHPTVNRRCLYHRIASGMDVEVACKTPNISNDGWKFNEVRLPKEQVMIAVNNGLDYNTVRSRITIGVPIEEAITRPKGTKGFQKKTKPNKRELAEKVKKEEKKLRETDVRKYKKIAMKNGIALDTYFERVYKLKMSPQEAAK